MRRLGSYEAYPFCLNLGIIVNLGFGFKIVNNTVKVKKTNGKIITFTLDSLLTNDYKSFKRYAEKKLFGKKEKK